MPAGRPMALDQLLRRNFWIALIPLVVIAALLNEKVVADDTGASAPPSDLSDPKSLPVCDGVKVLVIAASSDKDWSFAVLSQGGEKDKTVLRRRGGEFNGKTVFFVGWDRIWMGTGS